MVRSLLEMLTCFQLGARPSRPICRFPFELMLEIVWIVFEISIYFSSLALGRRGPFFQSPFEKFFLLSEFGSKCWFIFLLGARPSGPFLRTVFENGPSGGSLGAEGPRRPVIERKSKKWAPTAWWLAGKQTSLSNEIQNILTLFERKSKKCALTAWRQAGTSINISNGSRKKMHWWLATKYEN